VNPTTATISAYAGTTPGTQSITLSYATFTQGAPTFSSSISYNQGSGWLSISPTSGTMTQASYAGFLYTYTATITVSADPTGIPAGSSYGGTINFNAGSGIASLPVTFNVNAQPSNLPLPTGGIANAASGGQAPVSVVTPGSYIAIYGTNLAGTGNPSATTIPLPTTLNGASATLCGVPMPLLYASASQINALVPDGLNAATCPLIVTSNNTASAPIQLTITPVQPGIYTLDTSGSGTGIVTNALTGKLINAANPAHAGDYLVVYTTGLGPVHDTNGNPGPAVGALAPTTTIYYTNSTVTATLGGVSTPVVFSGLTPTFADLYQINIQVPTGVTPGNAVPLSVTAVDPTTKISATSNTVTIAVQ
jgi:uncharacterized protein (TIGR03437 family)